MQELVDYPLGESYGLTLRKTFLAVLTTVAVGTVLGFATGYLSGIVDEVLSIIINVAITIPTYLPALIIVIVMLPELRWNSPIMAAVLSMTAWVSLTRKSTKHLL